MTNTESEEKLLTGLSSKNLLTEDNFPKLSAKEFLIKTSASDLRNIFGIENSDVNLIPESKPVHSLFGNTQTSTESHLPNIKPKIEVSEKKVVGLFPKNKNRIILFRIFATLILLSLIVLDFLYIWGALISKK